MVKTGLWMFRWRSFLPLLVVPLFVWAAYDLWVQGGQASSVTGIVDIVALCVSICGLMLRAFTVGHAPPGTSGRNTKEQRATVLNSDGIYSVVRHPLYLANYLMFAGFLLATHDYWLMLTCSLVYFIYYERIMMAEEDFLAGKFGKAYEDWAAVTPAFLPRLGGWRPSSGVLSWRKIIRSETHGLTLIAVVFAVLRLAMWWIGGGEYPVMWMGFAAVMLVLLTAVVVLKKTTKIFAPR
ncbi:MAG: isoprenylcysteine carboxylmethyltransferase family protein [Alphaproteobacteria bacterium]|nr:isoprenylcysteine carboxylmethyltransferase family protein [Alphaproteobacteria bacterium]